MHVCAYVCRRTLLRRSEVDVQRHWCTINLQASVRDAHIFTKVCAIFCRGCSMALERLWFMNSRHTPCTLVCRTPI